METDLEMLMEADGGGDPGGVRDETQLAPDAPGSTTAASPAGMELTFPTSTDPAAFEEGIMPETVLEEEDSSAQGQPQRKITFQQPQQSTNDQEQKPTQFREQFDHLMNRLEDRFQGERLSLEEKHSRELEEAMGYFSLSSGEREAKQQELQMSLLEDIGSMAQQLHDLTGALGPADDVENLTLPSDPKVLEEYARKMQALEEQFQAEKIQLEQKHATEMEQALGTLKMTTGQREAKQAELQDQLSAEIGDMANQLDELNQAKEAYELKMDQLKEQLTKEDAAKTSTLAPENPHLQSVSRQLRDVERERDTAQDELRRLKLALEVTGNPQPAEASTAALSLSRRSGPTAEGRLSPQEKENISSLRGRIEQMERELKEAASTPGGSDTMKHLRDRMLLIEKDLLAAEEMTKEHFALENLRARMEKVERLLTEGERAAKDWETLEELRNKIGHVDNDLKAVEDAKREFEAMEALRTKMEEVESELKAAERAATDRENVENLRARLGQVERELGVADPSGDDGASVNKLLSRLVTAEKSLEDARASTKFDERQYPTATLRGLSAQKLERDDEVEKILERLALAEKKLKAAKDSAQRRNPSGGYMDQFNPLTQTRYANRPPSATPFDERQSKIRARLEEHLDETDPSRRIKHKDPPSTGRRTMNWNSSPTQRGVSDVKSKFEEPRYVGGRSNDRYYVEDVHLDRGVRLRPRYEEAAKSQPPDPVSSKQNQTAMSPPEEPTGVAQEVKDKEEPGEPRAAGTIRPLRRRRAGEGSEAGSKASRTMPYSVFSQDDEDKYVSDIEELRYQRSLLSSKLAKKKFEEEEKKADDQEEAVLPTYSFKETLRNDEKQRMKEKIYQRDKSPPKQTVDKLYVGNDPPTAEAVENSDPPTSAKDLQNRLALVLAKDPITEENEDKGRASVDPPDSATKSTPVEAPSDETSFPVEMPQDVDVDSVYEDEEPATITPETPPVISPPPQKENTDKSKALWGDGDADAVAKTALAARPSEPPQIREAPQPPQPPQPPPSPQPIINQTTIVDGKAAERANREKDRMMRWFAFFLFLLAVVLAVVIVVVIYFLRDNNDDNRNGPTVPTMPTMFPTISPAPSISTAPSPSATMPPVSFEGCPELDNDLPLILDGETVELTTVGAKFDASELGSCESIAENDIGSDGVWYYVFGTGGSVTLNTCTLFFPTFDTQMLVYTPVDPTRGCESGLQCVTSNDDFCGMQSSVTFQAEENTLYFVYINGMTTTSVTSNPSEGQFALTPSVVPEGSCSGAVGPLNIEPNDGQLPVVVVGSLQGGTFGVDPCNADLATRTGEYWYTVVGAGRNIVASTCHSISNFPARLAIYAGSSCNNLVCETSDDEDCGFGSEITWFGERNVEYRVLVYSPSYVPDVTFGITIMDA